MRKAAFIAILVWTSTATVHWSTAQTITRGVEMEVVYTGDLVANIVGGIDQGIRFIDNLDIAVSIDGDSFGWNGGGILLYGIGNQGGNITSLVGDAQVVNNIEAPQDWRLFEAWIEQSIGNRFSILAGLYDLNSEFDVNRNGALFLNSSHGTGLELSQSGRNGPSIFPVTSLGFRARAALTNWLEVRAVALDGVPGDPAQERGTHIVLDEDDGLLVAGEVEFTIDSGRAHEHSVNVPRRLLGPISSRARVVLGAWAYTKEMPTIATPSQTGRSDGVYILAEWCPIREEQDRTQGLSTFLRAGLASEQVNRFSGYIGTGVLYTGLVEGRDHDRVGLAIAVGVNGDPYMSSEQASPASGSITRTETNLEATYAAQVSPWLTVAADVQYVVNPNTRGDIPNALVPTLRVVVAP
ncbi:MAG: carbohydrate porin [Rhodothermia bacterium]|nr:carbohydrate porin [Rhodothermia bacterium]